MLKRLTKEELEERYRKERDPTIKERLLAILLLYDGKKRSSQFLAYSFEWKRCSNALKFPQIRRYDSFP